MLLVRCAFPDARVIRPVAGEAMSEDGRGGDLNGERPTRQALQADRGDADKVPVDDGDLMFADRDRDLLEGIVLRIAHVYLKSPTTEAFSGTWQRYEPFQAQHPGARQCRGLRRVHTAVRLVGRHPGRRDGRLRASWRAEADP